MARRAAEAARLARAAGLGTAAKGPVRCGTARGHLHHAWRGTPACPPCEAAWVAFAAWCRVHGDMGAWRRRD